jgi:hypothetical protein
MDRSGFERTVAVFGGRPDMRRSDRGPFLCGFEKTPYATSVPGVYAVGDVRADSLKRVASAVGEGSVVISYIHRYPSCRAGLYRRVWFSYFAIEMKGQVLPD